jgi:hypothetical protein
MTEEEAEQKILAYLDEETDVSFEQIRVKLLYDSAVFLHSRDFVLRNVHLLKDHLICVRAFLSVAQGHHAARKAANSAKGSWGGTLAEVISRYALSDEDQRRIAVSLTKLVESKRAEHAATQELIEALTTVLPQGG